MKLEMEPHGVFKEVTKQFTNKDHYQSVIQSDLWLLVADVRRRRHPAVVAVWCRIRGFCWGRMEMKEEVVVVVVVKRGGGGGG